MYQLLKKHPDSVDARNGQGGLYSYRDMDEGRNFAIRTHIWRHINPNELRKSVTHVPEYGKQRRGHRPFIGYEYSVQNSGLASCAQHATSIDQALDERPEDPARDPALLLWWVWWLWKLPCWLPVLPCLLHWLRLDRPPDPCELKLVSSVQRPAARKSCSVFGYAVRKGLQNPRE